MIKFKRGTYETLSSINPIIDSGQPCVATNYNGGGAKLVIGDGSTVFNDLPYVTLQDEDVLTVPNVVGLGCVPQSTDAGITWTRDLRLLGDVGVETLTINNQLVESWIKESVSSYNTVTSPQESVNFNWRIQYYNDGQVRIWCKFSILVYPYTDSTGLGDFCKYGYTLPIPLPMTFRSISQYSKNYVAQVGTGLTIVTTGGLNDSGSSIGTHWASNVDARVSNSVSTLQVQVMGQI